MSADSIIDGHESAETAYVIEDYPYGFRLRCQMRVWVETKPKQGQRVMRQTSNPKRPGLVWNKPKASTYSPIILLALDDNGHVEPVYPDIFNGTSETLQAFEDAYIEHLNNYQRETLRYLRAGKRAMKHVTYAIHSHEYAYGETRPACETCDNAKPYREQQKDEAKLINGLIRHELWEETREAIAHPDDVR